MDKESISRTMVGMIKKKLSADSVADDIIKSMNRDELAVVFIKHNGLLNLAWQYINTCCDQCAIIKKPETKLLCREVNRLKRDYERYRARWIEFRETAFADWFEEIFYDDFTKLYYGIRMYLMKLNLEPNDYYLAQATYQALTVLEAANLFAKIQLKRLTPKGCDFSGMSLMNKHVNAVRILVPEFCGGVSVNDIQVCADSVKILVNRMQALRYDDEHDQMYYDDHKDDEKEENDTERETIVS